MRRVALLVLALGALTMASGCFTLNWAHNKRHVRTVWEEVQDLHQDVDKTLFGLDRYPTEK